MNGYEEHGSRLSPYHSIEEMESELAFDIASNTQETPDNIKKRKCFPTGIAWDNYW